MEAYLSSARSALVNMRSTGDGARRGPAKFEQLALYSSAELHNHLQLIVSTMDEEYEKKITALRQEVCAPSVQCLLSLDPATVSTDSPVATRNIALEGERGGTHNDPWREDKAIGRTAPGTLFQAFVSCFIFTGLDRSV
jgi:hypothetical protein